MHSEIAALLNSNCLLSLTIEMKLKFTFNIPDIPPPPPDRHCIGIIIGLIQAIVYQRKINPFDFQSTMFIAFQ